MQQLSRDGITLRYEEAGAGAPPLLFVHGALDHTQFAAQLAHFRSSHRVVAPDLRGYGQSDKPAQEYTIAGFADDIAWLCQELGLAKPVVVGHSMGGVIALDLAARYLDLPAAIAMLDAPVLVPPPVAAALNLAGFIAALRTPAYRDAVRGFFGGTFLPTDDPERRARILDQMAEAPQYVAASAFENTLRYDAAPAATAVTVPALFIHAVVPTDLDRFRELCPQLVTGQTVGSGHFHHLEVPEQVNAMIDRFLAIAVLRQAGAATPAVAATVGR
jgi:pimeloyl-ACP methyl ester carboxylesterase